MYFREKSVRLSLKENVKKHLHYVDLIYQTSKKLLDALSKKDVDNLEFHAGNRERMVNIVAALQKKIQKDAKEVPVELIQDTNNTLISWKKEFTFFLKEIEDIDVQIINKLESLKKETSTQMSVNFKFKEHIKRYNQNNLRG